MTAQEAYSILDQATQPQNAGRINRAGYVQIEEALAVILALISKEENK